MGSDKLSTEEIVEYYRSDVEKLVRYLSYFGGKRANDVSHKYTGDGSVRQTMSFPIYDSTLMSFVKEADNTVFINKNYRYVYTQYHIKSHDDEWRMIEQVTLKDMDILGGILSKYVLGGRTKGNLWAEAVEYEIFYRVILKAKELIDFWDKSALR